MYTHVVNYKIISIIALQAQGMRRISELNKEKKT